MNNQEIYEIIDNYKYYNDFKKRNNFTQNFINTLNKELMDDREVKELQNKPYIKKEILNVNKFNNNIPFPLLYYYLKSLKVNNIPYFEPRLYNFYKDCWPYLDDMGDVQKKIFFSNIRNNIFHNSWKYADNINGIINDLSFLDLIKEIMASSVMRDAYKCIYYWYSTNGECNLDKERIENNINEIKNLDENPNLMSNHPIIYYYSKFCEPLNNLDINVANPFIVFSLPSSIKGFTFRFLKIVVNPEGIVFPYFQNEQNNKKIKLILLKAYLIFLLIQEQNHFLDILCKTPDIKGYDEDKRQLIELLFGDESIKTKLNIEQAKYILDSNKWKKSSVYEFKRDFLAIKSGKDIDKCFIYLSSYEESMCDHSKLVA